MLEKLTYEVKTLEEGVGVVFNRPPKRVVLDFLKSKGFKWNWSIKAWVHKTMSVDKINEIMQKRITKTYGVKFYGTEAVVVDTQMYADTESIETEVESKPKAKTTKKTTTTKSSKKTESKTKKALCSEKQRVQIVLNSIKNGEQGRCDRVFVSNDTQVLYMESGAVGIILKDNLLTDTNLKYEKEGKYVDIITRMSNEVYKDIKASNHRLDNFYEFVDVASVYQKHEGVENVACIKNENDTLYFNPALLVKALKVAFANCETIAIQIKKNQIKLSSKDNKNVVIACGVLNISERIKDIVPTYEV